MINSSHNKLTKQSRRTFGAVTLVFTLIMLMISTLLILFAGNYALIGNKMLANYIRFDQAFEAAEAGLEYGIVYLKQNRATILASTTGGFINPVINSNVTNVVLANGSKYTVTFSNPIANDYKLILVSSTGKSDDDIASHSMSQLVYFGSILLNPPNLPVVSKGNVTMGGNSTVTNTETGSTIRSGGTVTMSGGSQTVTGTGTHSAPGNIQGDISQNNTSISNQTAGDFFATYFGIPSAAVKSSVAHYYSSSSSQSYNSTLAGMTGTSVWIDQLGGSANLSGNTTIGSATNPVLVIVNGDLNISGNVQIYGFVYVTGSSSQTTDITGNLTITGGLINGGNLMMSGNININYNSTVITNLQNELSYYARVPGSWKDF